VSTWRHLSGTRRRNRRPIAFWGMPYLICTHQGSYWNQLATELLRRVTARLETMSTEPFDELLTPHLEAMRGFVRRRMRMQDDVDDVVQRTLLLAFAHRQQLRNPAKFKSWLCSIAVNEIRMIVRSTRPCVSLSVCPELEAVEMKDAPFMRFQERERQTSLRLAIARLHQRDQAAIQSELDGLSIAQIAAATATTRAAAKSARFRARQRLVVAMRNQRLVPGVGSSR
jgi:RNA polymerase sigma-70 factor (ECF subfamily)